MKNKMEFIKLFIIAVICHSLLIVGFLLIKLSYLAEGYLEYLFSGVGLLVFMNTCQYIYQHELKRKLRMTECLLVISNNENRQP